MYTKGALIMLCVAFMCSITIQEEFAVPVPPNTAFDLLIPLIGCCGIPETKTIGLPRVVGVLMFGGVSCVIGRFWRRQVAVVGMNQIGSKVETFLTRPISNVI